MDRGKFSKIETNDGIGIVLERRKELW